MRLAVAAAILAETLPVVLSSDSFSNVISGELSNGVQDGLIQDFLESKKRNMIQLKGTHPTGEKLKTMNRRRLINSGDESLQECDPRGEGVDVGILSCGAGRYCVESDESPLGGYCASIEMSRNLQLNSTLISDLFDVCYGETAYAASCTCSGVDVAAYTGSISCTYSPECLTVPNACGENSTFCYTQTYDLTVTAQYTGSAKNCYFFNEPKEQSYCFTLVIPADGSPQFCEIEVDGTKCNSCESSSQDYQGVYTDCTTFDCSNTNIASANTYCDYNIPTLQVQNTLLYDVLPCENGCSICGEGNSVLNPDALFTIAGNDTYPCGVIELAALAGYFEGTDLCTQLTGPFAETCGCSGTAPTGSTPSESPFACDICGDGLVVTNSAATLEVPNQGSVSCSQLSEPGFLSAEECSVVQPLVQVPCGCAAPNAGGFEDPLAPGGETVASVTGGSGSFALSAKAALSMAAAAALGMLLAA